jgi:hypothetical protein
MSDPRITFKNPPPDPRGTKPSRHWQEVADELMSRPGEWALVGTINNAAMVTQINKGQTRAFEPAGAFEATSRANGEKRDLYVRYVGDPR